MIGVGRRQPSDASRYDGTEYVPLGDLASEHVEGTLSHGGLGGRVEARLVVGRVPPPAAAASSFMSSLQAGLDSKRAPAAESSEFSMRLNSVSNTSDSRGSSLPNSLGLDSADVAMTRAAESLTPGSRSPSLTHPRAKRTTGARWADTDGEGGVG